MVVDGGFVMGMGMGGYGMGGYAGEAGLTLLEWSGVEPGAWSTALEWPTTLQGLSRPDPGLADLT
jgi:hypothetical protein